MMLEYCVSGWPPAERASKFEKNRQVGEARDEFFHAHHAPHESAGASRAHAAVAFVGADADGAGLGTGEVDAGDPHVRLVEAVAEVDARHLGELLRVVGEWHAEEFRENFADLLRPHVHDRVDQVRRMIVCDLHDQFAQIRFHRLNARRRQGIIKLRLLRHHRLRFHNEFGIRSAGDVDDKLVGFLGVGGEVHMPAGFFDVVSELFEVEVEMIEAMGLDVARQ